jgi:hypothetical protein
MNYVLRIPRKIPQDHVMVHNPPRAWTQPLADALKPWLTPCHCGLAGQPHLRSRIEFSIQPGSVPGAASRHGRPSIHGPAAGPLAVLSDRPADAASSPASARDRDLRRGRLSGGLVCCGQATEVRMTDAA